MKILLKHVKPLNFKGISIWGGNWQSTWYKVIPALNRVVLIKNLIPKGVFYFQLTKKEMRDYSKGKISLIPPGCCNPIGGYQEINERITVFEGEIKSQKHLRELLDKCGALE